MNEKYERCLKYFKKEEARVRKEVTRIKRQRKRARDKKVECNFSLDDWYEALRFFNYSCAYCGKTHIKLTQEHIVPVSGGGGYIRGNIIPACGPCNQNKSSENLEAWYKKQSNFKIERLVKIHDYQEANKECIGHQDYFEEIQFEDKEITPVEVAELELEELKDNRQGLFEHIEFLTEVGDTEKLNQENQRLQVLNLDIVDMQKHITEIEWEETIC